MDSDTVKRLDECAELFEKLQNSTQKSIAFEAQRILTKNLEIISGIWLLKICLYRNIYFRT